MWVARILFSLNNNVNCIFAHFGASLEVILLLGKVFQGCLQVSKRRITDVIWLAFLKIVEKGHCWCSRCR